MLIAQTFSLQTHFTQKVLLLQEQKVKKDHQKEHPTVAIKLLLFGGDKLLKQNQYLSLLFSACKGKEKSTVLYLKGM